MAASSEDTGLSVQNFPCDDFLQFQDNLKKMRSIDDKIIYELNNTVPTAYFAKDLNITSQCKSFYEQLNDSHQRRSVVINKCLKEASDRVNQKKEEQHKDADNILLLKTLRNEQKKLRLIQQEISVEEIIRDRTIKSFYEKCRNAYTPPIDRPLV